MRCFVALACVCLCTAVAAKGPLPPDQVPGPLKPWVGWVLHDKEMLACPPAFNDAARRSCLWPSELELALGDEGASFRMSLRAYAADTEVELPGDAEFWPQDVRIDAKAAVVTAVSGRPALRVPAGAHVVTGTLVWQTLPQSLVLPRATGTLAARLRGEPLVAGPDAAGRLWLRRPQEARGGDALVLKRFRLIDDAVPMRASARFELAVSGRARELALPAALLPEFVPMALDSPLPARIDAEGRLVLQVRPGNWTVSLTGRRMTPAKSLELPQAVEGEEVWSFVPHNELRVVNVSGAPAVDPKSVGVPGDWQAYPAYLVPAGGKLALDETRRGDAEGEPDRLNLARRMWLDFDGGGYTVEDRLTGTLSRTWRLEIAPPFVLGRAAVDGEDQAITRLDKNAAAGIEVRHGRANLIAESRVEGGGGVLPASGWHADISGYQARLELPPGWRLLHVSGADRSSGTWLANWSLWDLFFALLICVAAARLAGVVTGLILAVAFALAWHTPGAPVLPWLALLAFHAIAKALPDGRLKRVAGVARGAVALAILAALLPFAVDQLRQSLYPALELPYQVAGSPAAPPPAAAPAPAMAEAVSQDEAEQDKTLSDRRVRQAPRAEVAAKRALSSVAQGYTQRSVDPNARIQTGPGLPAWTWHTHQIELQGPVSAAQTLRLVLLPPWATALWAIGSVVLLALGLWRCAGVAAAQIGTRWRAWTAAVAVLLIGAATLAPLDEVQAATRAPSEVQAAAAARGGNSLQQLAGNPDGRLLPSQEMLDELGGRLSAPPACLPACAEIARMVVMADAKRLRLRLEVHAAADVAVPLPGNLAQWQPAAVQLDGKPADLRRDEQGTLWLRVGAGVHVVSMEGASGDRETLNIALPLAPRRLTGELAGWTLSGTDARGLAGGMIELTRERRGGEQQAEETTSRDSLPPFVRIERRIVLGQRWRVHTSVAREGPSLAPLTVRVRLLAGEGVTDPRVKVDGGVALLSLGSQGDVVFESSLEERAKLELVAGDEPAQIETWVLDASTQWHVMPTGIPPAYNRVGDQWLPTWLPWPGEKLSIAIAKPTGVDGPTLTIDAVRLRAAPGKRSGETSAELSLRTSRGGNHPLTLPEGATLLAVNVDGVAQPARTEGRKVSVGLLPGAHRVKIDWRDDHGIAWHFALPRLDLGGQAVNLTTELGVPGDRVVLAVGGPRLGPAVLLWGVLAVVLAGAWLLSRLKFAPLGFFAWSLLGVGLAQASLGGLLVILGWFAALAARARFAPNWSRGRFNLGQLMLVIWTIAAGATLFETLRGGLLGYPDLLIAGNGSSAFDLRWFSDRSASLTPEASAYSIPVFVYRVLMLAWALWLAAALIRWLRWAWSCYTSGGYWKPAPPKGTKAAPAVVESAPPAGNAPEPVPDSAAGQEAPTAESEAPGGVSPP